MPPLLTKQLAVRMTLPPDVEDTIEPTSTVG